MRRRNSRFACHCHVHGRHGDGYFGWPDAAPFDGIIVTCSPREIPPPLTGQLRDGGRLVIPVEEAFGQTLLVFEKELGELRLRNEIPVRFVPMTGRAETA